RSSRDVDHRADLWSLGVILYQLVTNALPFKGPNLTGLISAVLVGRYPAPSEVKPGLGVVLDPIIARCFDREIGRRYPSVAELAEDLPPLAPTAAGHSVERILRLLRPNSASPSNRIVLSSYEAPIPTGSPVGAPVTTGSPVGAPSPPSGPQARASAPPPS